MVVIRMVVGFESQNHTKSDGKYSHLLTTYTSISIAYYKVC